MKYLLLKLIRLYQIAISPLLGSNCRFHPTCSNYAKQAIQTHGAFKGAWLTLKRFSKCGPPIFSKTAGHGYDPVPPKNVPSKK